MGWDCHAIRKGRLLRYKPAPHRIYDAILDAAFCQAAKEARRLGGAADVLLACGATPF